MKALIPILLLTLLVACNSKISLDVKPGANTTVSFPALQWGQDFFTQYGGVGSGDEYASTAISDSQGNVYIAGTTTGNMLETQGGSSDIVISKFNSRGERVWMKHVGAESATVSAAGWDNCNALALDNSGYLYCAGSTNGGLADTNGGGPRSDLLLIKLNAATGAVVWYKQWGLVGGAMYGGNTGLNEWFEDMKFYNGKLYFCASSSSAFKEASNGLYDFVAGQMDLNGNFDWITQVGSVTAPMGTDMTGRDYAGKLALDGTHLYCGGMTNGSFSEPNGGAAGTYDLLFMKFHMTTGALVSYKQFGSTTMAAFGGRTSAGNDYGCYDLEFDRNGDLLCLFNPYGTFGDTDVGNTGDVAVLKLDTNFNPIWVTQLGANTLLAYGSGSNAGYDYVQSLYVDSNNDILMSGYTDGSLGEANGGGYDGILVKVSSAGTLMNITQYGATTDLGDSNNSGDEFFAWLLPIGNKLYNLGSTGGSSYDTVSGVSDILIYPLSNSL